MTADLSKHSDSLQPEATKSLPTVELDKILVCNCGMNLDNGKHYEDCPKAAKPAILQLIKQARADEVEMYADYLSDCEDEQAFEYAWQEFAYKRVRAIDAE